MSALNEHCVTWANAALQWPRGADYKLVQRLVDQHFIGQLECASADEIAAFSQMYLLRLLRFCNYTQTKLTDLPVTSRAHYHAEHIKRASAPNRSWLPPEHGRVIDNHTSGSVGVPIEFWCSEFSVRLNAAHYDYDHRRQGRNLRRTRALLDMRVAPPSSPSVRHREVPCNPWQGEMGGLVRRAQSYQPLENARWLAELQPSYLSAQPVVLGSVMAAFDESGVKAPAIEQIQTYGETVTLKLRADAFRLFGARIADCYSCEEIGPLAFQCPHSELGENPSYHCAVSNAIIEILRDDGSIAAAGEIGRVVATGLHNYASPAVRYDLGDLAAMQPRCNCGFNGPVLSNLLGRSRFLLKLADGSRRIARAENWLKIAPISAHRVTQIALDSLLLEVECPRTLAASELEALRQFLQDTIGLDAQYEVRQVAAIAWARTRKRQDFVSLVD